MNHHEILGVGTSANEAEIQRAFRQAAKELHPDKSKSSETAEAFIRIKEARDALLKEAEDIATKEAARAAAASAVSSVTKHTSISSQPPLQTLTPAQVAHLQELDRQVAKASAFSLLRFKRTKESDELKRHRHRIKTNDRRLNGKY